MFFPDLQQLSEKLKFAAAYQPASVLNYPINIQLNTPQKKEKANHFKIIIICYWFLLEVLLFSVNCTSKKLKKPPNAAGRMPTLFSFLFFLFFNGSHHIQ